MGAFCKLLDAALFVFFLFIAVVAPLIDAQTCLPGHFFPPFLVELKSWYAQEYGDYLVSEKPHFFVGAVWLELIFQWPLAVACVYGIAAGKSWLATTCLMYGVSTLTSMGMRGNEYRSYQKMAMITTLFAFLKVVILAELTLSNRASDKLLMMYFPVLGFALLALLRGLLTSSGKSITIGKRSALNRKKRA